MRLGEVGHRSRPICHYRARPEQVTDARCTNSR
jgi:hypothetical protein